MLRRLSTSFRSRREFDRIAKAYPGSLDWLLMQPDEPEENVEPSPATLDTKQERVVPAPAITEQSKEVPPDGESFSHFAHVRGLADHIARGLQVQGASSEHGAISFPTLLCFQEAVAGDLIQWLSEESSEGERNLVALCLNDLQRFETTWHATLYGSWWRRCLAAL